MYSGKKIIVSCSYSDSIINLRGKLIEGFAKNNEVILITPSIHDKTTWQKLQEWKIKVFEIKLYPNKFNILSDLHYLTALYKIIRKAKPDMYFAYTIKPICYGNLAAALCRVKQVSSLFTGLGFMFQNAGPVSLSRQLVHRLLKLSLNINKSTTIFFQNDDDRQELLKMQIIDNRSPAYVVNGSGVDLERFYYQQPAINHISFIMIAVLKNNKGIREFFESASLIKNNYQDADFHLLGEYEKDGTDSIGHELFLKIKDGGIVKYHGWVDDVRPFIANSSVMVLPSHREGVPRSILEAMAIGRPVITTNAIGCKETVTSDPNEINGFLVDVNDVNALAGKMEFFIQNPDKIIEYGLNGRKFAAKRFDVSHITRQMMVLMKIE